MANTIVWADIPVTDMARARTFQDTILGAGSGACRGLKTASFCSRRTWRASMGNMVGNIAFFLDTEGNRIGLHSVG